MDEGHPKCPECNAKEFSYDRIHRAGSDIFIYIVYCTECGHIVGCAGPHA